MKLPIMLPESFLRCLAPAERRKLNGGAYTTPEEALRRSVAKNERQLQTQIVNLLRLKGIEPLWHRTDKKSAATVGWPDITFCIWGDEIEIDRGYYTQDVEACGWEIKFGKGELSKEQQQMHVRLSTPPNAWRIKIIRSVDEAIAELKEIGIQ